MSQTSQRIRIAQRSEEDRTITAWDVARNEFDVETGRTRTDLTTDVVYFTVKDKNGVVVISKVSTDVAEILKSNQLVPATKGQAKIFFLEADTSTLIVGDEYWHDSWIVRDGKKRSITRRGKFIVDESVTVVP